MKKTTILLLLTVLFSTQLSAQSPIKDTIMEKRVRDLEKEMDFVTMNMGKHHAEFKTGVTLQVIGAILMTAAGVSTSTDKNVIMAGCSAIFITGTVFTIDSHKYFGRSSKVKDYLPYLK